MKVVTKNYYQSIKEIEYNTSECIKKVYPIHKAGENKFLFGKYKENIYNFFDLMNYSQELFIGNREVTINKITPITGYTFEHFDNFISICRYAYIMIDGVITYFSDNETYEKYLSVIKGRCKDVGNPIYKTIILDNPVIY